MQQHRTIEVGDATLECTLCGLGAPVVLLANAGCSTGYFDHLARALGLAQAAHHAEPAGSGGTDNNRRNPCSASRNSGHRLGIDFARCPARWRAV